MAINKKRLLALTLCAGFISASAFTLKTAYAVQTNDSADSNKKSAVVEKSAEKVVNNETASKGAKIYVYSTTYKDAPEDIRAEHEENCKSLGINPSDDNVIDIPLGLSEEDIDQEYVKSLMKK